MKTIKHLAVAALAVGIFASCSNKESVGKGYADKACGIVKSNFDAVSNITVATIGIKREGILEDMAPTSEQRKELEVLVKEMFKEVQAETDKEAKKQIIKGFIKGLVDSDCVNITLDKALEFEALLKGLI